MDGFSGKNQKSAIFAELQCGVSEKANARGWHADFLGRDG
jgi:hypothetical protein